MFCRKILHPMWASPRLVLFLELNPFYGFLIPIVSLMRGYIWFGLLRWALNFASLMLWLTGRAILQPAYKEACCYGLEFLAEDHLGGKCDEPDLRADRGFELCEPDFIGPTHKRLLLSATVLFTVSSCLQLCNLMTIDWDILNRVGRIQIEMKKRLDDLKENKEVKSTRVLPLIKGEESNVTVNLSEIMSRMGMTRRLLKMAFPEMNIGTNKEWTKHMHRHPQWAHPGLFRMLLLDPVLGFVVLNLKYC